MIQCALRKSKRFFLAFSRADWYVKMGAPEHAARKGALGMIFYTADLHLGYFPILHDTARPFASVEQMDRVLIDNWNARVGRDDTVYIVGDFSYNGGEAPTQYLSRLNGTLHLIRGNHDT